jgi:hypothetical protein
MTTILVADPRLTVQEFLEQLLTEQGYAVHGEPDLVLTTQRTTAWFWGHKGVPVVVYDKDETIDVNDLMATVGEALQSPDDAPGGQAAAPSPPRLGMT